ncbi:hypothetical protein [Iningainema tapete]|uniref:Uncharacterized protein n=1 Tax=Iningainema tapete BLCC-T55 TaxID=2748662 RepID=A0A8J7CER1_9CYAN|nr:hypothetical protein [Iningainema tapete]MBD2773835.1 hypothetical protein [Iningainema tapete BLCC-T55]
MEINELMMLTDQDIDYRSLSENTLKELALGDELFIATSALGELSRRKISITALIAWEILSKSRGDRYLQASALEILFNLNREQAMDYISKQAQHSNPYILNTILELMIENESEFKSERALSIVRIVGERLQEFDESAEYPSMFLRDSFLKLYGYVKNIQAVDAIATPFN